MLAWFLLALLAFMALGMPVAFALGLTMLFLLVTQTDLPMVLLSQQMFVGADNYALIAIPFFMLAAEIMSCGGISRRIIGFFVAIIGWIRGGLAMTVVGSSMVISSFTGSSVADATMIGGVLIPEMKQRNYEAEYAAALVAVSTTLGVIIPPSIPMIVLGFITSTSVLDMFLGGILPGLFIGFVLLVFVYFTCRRKNVPTEARLPARMVLAKIREAGWALMLPVVVLGGLRIGLFTVTESSVFAVAYALFVATVIHREMSWKQFYQAMVNAAVMSSVVMLIVASATGSAWLLASEQVPQAIASSLSALTSEPWVFLLITVAFLTLVGMVMDLTPALLILGPIMLPVAVQFGIDPIHYSVVMVITLAFGLVTPPVGTSLYLTAGIAKVPVTRVIRQTLPMLVVAFACLLVVALVPEISTWLPKAMK